jgi:hypothetical protein
MVLPPPPPPLQQLYSVDRTTTGTDLCCCEAKVSCRMICTPHGNNNNNNSNRHCPLLIYLKALSWNHFNPSLTKFAYWSRFSHGIIHGCTTVAVAVATGTTHTAPSVVALPWATLRNRPTSWLAIFWPRLQPTSLGRCCCCCCDPFRQQPRTRA